ncbi:hypothetical protein C4D60_Mb06t15320 [Musa balbisiana]|uniref:Uncharacterized protein n=1 Tax=Musa balbisiana TaxID=52838 RepID=A0A4S8IN95_MUSBA|nr:hypothetical protein C4D60_Mb06t15320 [Musa balbisiana]
MSSIRSHVLAKRSQQRAFSSGVIEEVPRHGFRANANDQRFGSTHPLLLFLHHRPCSSSPALLSLLFTTCSRHSPSPPQGGKHSLTASLTAVSSSSIAANGERRCLPSSTVEAFTVASLVTTASWPAADATAASSFLYHSSFRCPHLTRARRVAAVVSQPADHPSPLLPLASLFLWCDRNRAAAGPSAVAGAGCRATPLLRCRATVRRPPLPATVRRPSLASQPQVPLALHSQ